MTWLNDNQVYLEIFHCVSQSLDGVSRVSSFYSAGVAHAHLVVQAVISGIAYE